MSIPTGLRKGGRAPTPILRSEIEEAQRHTNSNAAAARYLNVTYERYRKYAKLYGLFDQHLNMEGWGIDKGWSKKPTSIPLTDILAGKHPDYSLAKLKNRLIARKKIVEECSLCGFNERRITDQRVPLMLTFKDGKMRQNFSLENLQLLCYNCMFLTTGAPSVVYRGQITRSYTAPESIPDAHKIPMINTDKYDPKEEKMLEQQTILTDEEKNELLKQLNTI